MSDRERKLDVFRRLHKITKVLRRGRDQSNKVNEETYTSENGGKETGADHRLSEEDVKAHLWAQIAQAQEKDQFKSNKFFPHGCLDTLITDNIVTRLLQFSELDKKELSDVVNFVIEAPAKKILAIAICSNCSILQLSGLLKHCMTSEFCDNGLPITDRNRHQVAPFDKGGREFKPWTDTFEQRQWGFLAPVFENDKPDMLVSPQTPWPFVYYKKNAGSGGFGAVHKVIVHEAHRQHTVFRVSGNTGEAALKEMNQSEDVEGGSLQEAQALKDLTHDHIIEFIAAINQEPDHYLMFRWANGGDLGSYWAQNQNPKLSPGFVKSVVTQLRGLIEALEYMHTCSHGTYRHTDIKPANILRIVDDSERQTGGIGFLKISDLGLAKKHTKATSLRKGTVARATTYRYQPPEAAYDLTQEGIGRRYDIWSMGCVMLELIIWLLYGYEVLEEFSKWRGKDSHNRDINPFFEQSSDNFIEVHSVVSDIMDQLLEDQECQTKTALGDILRLVKDQMLVVGLKKVEHGMSLTAPSLDPSQRVYRTASQRIRAYSKDVLGQMSRMKGHEDDDSYWFSGQHRDDAAPLRDPRPARQNGEQVSAVPMQKGNPTIEITPVQDDGAYASPQPQIPTVYINGQPDSVSR